MAKKQANSLLAGPWTGWAHFDGRWHQMTLTQSVLADVGRLLGTARAKGLPTCIKRGDKPPGADPYDREKEPDRLKGSETRLPLARGRDEG